MSFRGGAETRAEPGVSENLAEVGLSAEVTVGVFRKLLVVGSEEWMWKLSLKGTF